MLDVRSFALVQCAPSQERLAFEFLRPFTTENEIGGPMKAMFLFAAMALSAAGCMHVVSVPSVQGKAFITKTTPFGGSFWNCDASGEPTCFQVTEQPLAGGK